MEAYNHNFLSAGHEHAEKRTWAVIWLCGIMMVLEIVGGWLFGSIALVADGMHMSTHAGALLLAAMAYSYARRHAADPRFTFSTGKLGDLAGFTSAIILAMIALLIGGEAVQRLLRPEPIAFAEAIPIAVLGLTVNVASAWLLGGGEHHHHGHGHDHARHDHENHARQHHARDLPHDHDHAHDHHDHDDAEAHHHGHGHADDHLHHHEHDDHADNHHAHRDNNMRAAIVHVMADAAVSVLVIAGLLLARAFGWMWIDPLVGIAGAVVIASWAFTLIRDTARILLDMNPDRPLTQSLREAIETDGDRIIDMHLWRLGPGHLGAVISVVTTSGLRAEDYRARLHRFKTLSHVTVEVRSPNV